MVTDSNQLLAKVEAAEHGSEAFPLPHTAVSRVLDGLINLIGRAVSWLWLVLIGIIIVNVVLRYVFSEGLILFEELQWHVYAIGFMIGLSFAVVADRHVRVDVVSEHLPQRTRAWIELFGLLFFLLPFAALLTIESVPFVIRAWDINEISIAPGGLGHRWAIKSVLIVAFGLLALAAVSRLTRVIAYLAGHRAPAPPNGAAQG